MFKTKIALIFFVIASVICGSFGDDGVEPTDDRIIEGEKVDDITMYPYMATFQLYDHHMCGATIINSRWLLCAAHCAVFWHDDKGEFVVWEVTNMTITVGTLHIFSQDAGSQRRKVAQFVVHPRYAYFISTNDIALIQVTRPLMLRGPRATPVRLTTTSNNEVDPKPRGKCVALGWGHTKPMILYPKTNVSQSRDTDYLEPSPDLLMVKLTLVPMKECQKNLTALPTLQKLHLCTSTDKGKDTCKVAENGNGTQAPRSAGNRSWIQPTWALQSASKRRFALIGRIIHFRRSALVNVQGDSGGPLMCNGQQWGIASWSESCGHKDSPTVWTRVDGYRTWIRKVIWKPHLKPRASSSYPKGAGSKQNGYLAVVHVFSVLFAYSRDGMGYGN